MRALLHGYGGVERARRRREHCHRTVAEPLDDDAVGIGDRRLDPAEQISEPRVGLRVAQATTELSGRGNIAEDDGPRAQRRCHDGEATSGQNRLELLAMVP